VKLRTEEKEKLNVIRHRLCGKDCLVLGSKAGLLKPILNVWYLANNKETTEEINKEPVIKHRK